MDREAEKFDNSRIFMIHYIPDAPIAQLDRATDYESAGRGFESLWARQKYLLFQMRDKKRWHSKTFLFDTFSFPVNKFL